MKIEIKIPERYTIGGDWSNSNKSTVLFSPVEGAMEVRIVSPGEQTFYVNLRDIQSVVTRLTLLYDGAIMHGGAK